MARIRTIKPSFFRSEDVSVLPFRARLTWIGLWTHCDDAGRAKDNVRLIKGDIWPLDEVSLRDIEEDLETLAGHGRIVRYEVDGKRYLEIANWSDHQSIQKPTASKLPPSTEGAALTHVDSRTHTVAIPDGGDTTTAGKGREGRGREGTRASARDAPPDRCPKHLDDTDPPPCGACAGARKARERHDREVVTEAARVTQAAAHGRAGANQLAIAACTLCDDRGYVGTVVCPHDPGLADRTRKRAAETRNRLGGLAGGDRCPDHNRQPREGCVHCHPEVTA